MPSRSRRTMLALAAAVLGTTCAMAFGDAFGYTGGLGFGDMEVLNQGRPGAPLLVRTRPTLSIVGIEPLGLTVWVSCYLGVAMVSFLLTWWGTGLPSSASVDPEV